jgi:hypothetical protein
MSDEYGNQLFLGTFLDIFSQSSAILWIYPVLAFTFSMRYNTEIGRILHSMFDTPLEQSGADGFRSFFSAIPTNTAYGLVILLALLALSFGHGLVIAIVGLILTNLGVIEDVVGVERVALVTGFFSLIGHLMKEASTRLRNASVQETTGNPPQ